MGQEMSQTTDFSLNDIRPQKRMEEMEKIPNIGAKRKKLLAQKSDFVIIACPACLSKQYQFIFDKKGFQYVKCQKCELVYNNPRPNEEMLEAYYTENPLYRYWNEKIFSETEQVRRDKIFKPRVDMLIEVCKEKDIHPGKLLEIGAGYGTFCLELQSRNIFNSIIAIEPAEELAHTCVKRGLETLHSPYEKIDPENIKADVIVSFEVIEHLYDPANFIDFCFYALNSKGILTLSFPNMDGFDAMLLREKSGSVGGEHINMFNQKSITSILERFGFNLLFIKTPGKLDAELVRNAVLQGEYDISNQPFLQEALIRQSKKLGRPFQTFISENGLSSHMVVVAQKKE